MAVKIAESFEYSPSMGLRVDLDDSLAKPIEWKGQKWNAFDFSPRSNKLHKITTSDGLVYKNFQAWWISQWIRPEYCKMVDGKCTLLPEFFERRKRWTNYTMGRIMKTDNVVGFYHDGRILDELQSRLVYLSTYCMCVKQLPIFYVLLDILKTQDIVLIVDKIERIDDVHTVDMNYVFRAISDLKKTFNYPLVIAGCLDFLSTNKTIGAVYQQKGEKILTTLRIAKNEQDMEDDLRLTIEEFARKTGLMEPDELVNEYYKKGTTPQHPMYYAIKRIMVTTNKVYDQLEKWMDDTRLKNNRDFPRKAKWFAKKLINTVGRRQWEDDKEILDLLSGPVLDYLNHWWEWVVNVKMYRNVLANIIMEKLVTLWVNDLEEMSVMTEDEVTNIELKLAQDMGMEELPYMNNQDVFDYWNIPPTAGQNFK